MALLATLEGVGACLGDTFGVFKQMESEKFKESFEMMLSYCYNHRSIVQSYMKLGPWGSPVVEFLLRYNELLQNSNYTPQEAASVVYFAMIAQQPAPTNQTNIYAVDWVKFDTVIYDKSSLEFNETLSDGGPNYCNVVFEYALAKGQYFKFSGKRFGCHWGAGNPEFIAFGQDVTVYRPLAECWAESVYHLNRFLKYNGLYDGVEKTLLEEKRKLQGLRAQAIASQAAAAKALAISRVNENGSEETLNKYKQQLQRANDDEKEILDELKKLENTPKGTGNVSAGGSSILPLLGVAAALFAFR